MKVVKFAALLLCIGATGSSQTVTVRGNGGYTGDPLRVERCKVFPISSDAAHGFDSKTSEGRGTEVAFPLARQLGAALVAHKVVATVVGGGAKPPRDREIVLAVKVTHWSDKGDLDPSKVGIYVLRSPEGVLAYFEFTAGVTPSNMNKVAAFMVAKMLSPENVLLIRSPKDEESASQL